LVIGTVLGSCASFAIPRKQKAPPSPHIELFSVHKQAQQFLFQTLDLSASLFFCRLLSTVRVPFAKRNISVHFLQILLVLLFVCFVLFLFLLCFEGGLQHNDELHKRYICFNENKKNLSKEKQRQVFACEKNN